MTIECNLIIEHDLAIKYDLVVKHGLSIKYDFVVDLTNSKPERLSAYSPGEHPGSKCPLYSTPCKGKRLMFKDFALTGRNVSHIYVPGVLPRA